MQMILEQRICDQEFNILRKRVAFYEKLSKLISKKRAVKRLQDNSLQKEISDERKINRLKKMQYSYERKIARMLRQRDNRFRNPTISP